MRDAIKIKSPDWAECRDNILDDSTTSPSYKILPELLKSNVNVLLFAGDYDLICNYIGIEDILQSVFPGPWTGRSIDYRALSQVHDFQNGLVYMRIYNASHMVPFDAPEAGLTVLDMLRSRADVKGKRAADNRLMIGVVAGLLSLVFVAAASVLFINARKKRRMQHSRIQQADSEKGMFQANDTASSRGSRPSSPTSPKPRNPERPFSPEEMNERFVHNH